MKEKLENTVLVIRCTLFFILHGSSARKEIQPRKIVIVQMAKLGDMVCTTPMFRAFKTAYPDAELAVVGNKINKEVLEGNTDVDKYYIFDGNITRIIEWFKKEKFDAAFLTAPNFPVLAALYLSGVKCIVVPKVTGGFSSQETRSYKILRNLVYTQNHPMGSYAPREYLRRLEEINIFSSDTKKFLFYSDRGKMSAEHLLNNIEETFLVGISPAAGNRIKQWPAERFGIIADYLISQYGAHIFILGGKQDLEESASMKDAMKNLNAVTDLTSILSVDELKAFISKLKLFVSVDTGPVYIAEAFDVPTVDITGPVDEKEQPPIGPRHRVVHIKNRKKPALFVMNARVYDRNEAIRQVEEITPEMVINEIDNLIRFLRA